MAKFIPGPLTGEIRNKLGAQVFSRNQHGAYTRAHVLPDETITDPRALTQARWAAACASWSADLNDTDRYGWISLASRLARRPGPINGRKLSGRTLFISSYCNLDNIDVAPLVGPPDNGTAGQLSNLTAACDADTPSLTIDANEGPDPPDQGLIVFASPPLSPARYTARDLWKQIFALPPNPAFPLELWSEYIAIFPVPAPGDVLILGVSPVAALTGISGPRLVARTIVTGTGVPMYEHTTTLTDAQIKALPSTPVSIVTATAGKLIVPVLTVLQLDCSAGAYTNISAGVANRLRTTCSLGRSFSLRNDTYLTPAAKRTGYLPPVGSLDAAPNTSVEILTNSEPDGDIEGTDLKLTCVNAAGAFTGGNAANTLKVTTFYQLIPAI